MLDSDPYVGMPDEQRLGLSIRFGRRKVWQTRSKVFGEE